MKSRERESEREEGGAEVNLARCQKMSLAPHTWDWLQSGHKGKFPVSQTHTLEHDASHTKVTHTGHKTIVYVLGSTDLCCGCGFIKDPNAEIKLRLNKCN